MRSFLRFLWVLVSIGRIVDAVPPPDTLIEKIPHLFDSAPPGTQWVDALGEIVLPEKHEWGHYAVKELDIGGTRCEANSTSLYGELDRRAVTCSPGYIQRCPDSYPRPCCPTGYPNCCSRSATVCCASGYFCQGLHTCCRTGSVGCGEGCCSAGTRCCGAYCCGSGYTCTGGRCVLIEQCPGKVKCGSGCCNSGNICCNGGTICCPGGTSCCGSKCCSSTSHCSSGQCVLNDPCPGKVRCGTGCCNAGNLCCNNGTICCAAGTTCCGSRCCSSGSHCSNGQCVANDPCPGKVRCGTGCCNAGNSCCNNGTVCCAAGTSCCGSRCCTSGYSCQSGQCVANDPCPGKVRCSSTSCCNAGTTCCGSKCCSSGSTCQNGNCVANDPCPGKVRCSNGCCPAGTECSGNGCCTRGKNCPGDPPTCPDPSQTVCPGKTYCCPRGYTCPNSLSGVCRAPGPTTSSVSTTIPIPASIFSLGSPDPVPTTGNGPTMVDIPPSDPALQYQPAGAWLDSAAGGALGICTNNTKVSSQAGATISYTFTGIAVGVKVVRGKKAMKYRIGVDGQDAGTLDSFSSNTVCTPEIGGGKEGLAAGGPHTITITLDGPSSSSDAGGSLFEFSGLTVVTSNAGKGIPPIRSNHLLVACVVLLFASFLWGS